MGFDTIKQIIGTYIMENKRRPYPAYDKGSKGYSNLNTAFLIIAAGLSGVLLGDVTEWEFLKDLSPLLALIVGGFVFGQKVLVFLTTLFEALYTLTTDLLDRQTKYNEQVAEALHQISSTNERIVDFQVITQDIINRLDYQIQQTANTSQRTLDRVQDSHNLIREILNKIEDNKNE